jgi:hypothetical protein
MALWNPYREEEVVFPYSGHGVKVTDIMGRSDYVLAKDGLVKLKLSRDPIYVEQAQVAPAVAPQITRVQRPVEFVSANAKTFGSDAAVVLHFANKADKELDFSVAFESDFGKKRGRLNLQKGSEGEVVFTLAPAERGFSTAAPLKGTVVWRVGKSVYFEKVEIGFLCSFPDGETAQRLGAFSNRAVISGVGSDGKRDEANIEFHHSRQALHLRVAVKDAVHDQVNDPGFLWRGDSLQIAFDTAPGYAYEYDEAIMQTRKKVSDIVVALGKRGMEIYRNKTYSEKFLPTGVIDNSHFPNSKIERAGEGIVYDLVIPWKELGLADEEVEDGMRLGFSLLVNDSDGNNTKRSYYSLFGGIADESGYNSYGYFNLMNKKE